MMVKIHPAFEGGKKCLSIEGTMFFDKISALETARLLVEAAESMWPEKEKK